MSKTTNEILFEKILQVDRRFRLAPGPHGPGPFRPEGVPPHPENPECFERPCRPGHKGHPGNPDCPKHGPRGRRPPMSRERILRVLTDYEGGVRQKALAETLHVGAPAMSEFIDKLEADGYIVREVDPSDKRATLISLTELGKARACEVQDEYDEHLGKLFANLSDEEKDELIKLLDKLLSDFDEGEKDE